MKQLETPVVLIIFKRLNTLKQVMNVLHEVKPQKLYIIADAARNENMDESEKVLQVREFIEQCIDWECEIYKNYARENMGCKKRIESGLNWVFEQEEQAIILEDDIVPSMTFFRFCQEMLEHYKFDHRIMQISGFNPLPSYEFDGQYLFTFHAPIWGWATWKRAWSLYDKDFRNLEKFIKNRKLEYLFPGRRNYKGQMDRYKEVMDKKLNSWAYQWHFTKMIQSGLGIVPYKNLVKNIGFFEDATHTTSNKKGYEGELNEMQFPIIFSDYVCREAKFDLLYQKTYNLMPIWKEFVYNLFPLEKRKKIKSMLLKCHIIKDRKQI